MLILRFFLNKFFYRKYMCFFFFPTNPEKNCTDPELMASILIYLSTLALAFPNFVLFFD